MDDQSGAPHHDESAPRAVDPARGDAVPGWTRPGPRPSVRHRPWSTVLLVLHTIAVASGAALVVLGAAMAVGDLIAPGPEDGGSPEAWGLVVGVVVGVVGVCVLVPTAILRTLVRRGRRAADQGWPGTLRGVAIATVVIAGVGLAAALTAGEPSSNVLGIVLGGTFGVPAVLLLVTMRSQRAEPAQRPTGGAGG